MPEVELLSGLDGRLRIWDHPDDGIGYVIGADTAENVVRDRGASRRAKRVSYVDDRPDYSAAIVIELETGRHVASWHGYEDPGVYGSFLCALGLYYNEALLVPELNGPGISVVERLLDLRYPNLYRGMEWNDIDPEGPASSWGWRTTRENRPRLIARISEILQTTAFTTRDKQLVDELRTMQHSEDGTPRAKGRDKDDRVIALGLALQGRYESLSGMQAKHVGPVQNHPDAREWNYVKERMKHGRRSPGLLHVTGAGSYSRSPVRPRS